MCGRGWKCGTAHRERRTGGRRDEKEREITATVNVNTEWVDGKTQRRQERREKVKRQK